MARGAAARLRVTPDLAASVGGRLRERRLALGRTLSDTAQAAGISFSYLSAIEIGNNVPSLPILARVAGVLGLSLNEVLRDLGQTVVQSGRVDEHAVGLETISHEDLLLRVAFVVSDPGDAGPCPVPLGGHEVFVYVRKGVLGVTVDEEAHELRTGDSLDANSAETIQYRALGRGRAVALWASVAELDGRRRRAGR